MNALRLLASGLLLAAPALARSTSELTLVVHHLYGPDRLEFAKPGLTTTSGEQISITRLAYLLSEPSLKQRDNEQWLGSHDWFRFSDASKGDSVHVLDNLPQQKFAALRFHIGPDAATDHSDSSVYPARHALNPLVNGLHWGWAGGFVYLAIEGNVALKSGSSGYSYHIAGAPNRMEVTLPLDVDLSRDMTIELDFHVEKLFSGKPPLTIASINSTHSREDDDVAAQIKTQIEQAFTVRSVHVSAARPLPAKPGAATALVGTPYRFTIAKGIPMPDLPTDFPLTNERVALGDRLFHETRLSHGEKQSCATCHNPGFAFSDHRPFSVGADGNLSERNAMPLFNLGWKTQFFWDGRAPSLRKQAMEPIQNPIEMHESLDRVVAKLASDSQYAEEFKKAYGTKEITAEKIGLALEAFVITLTSFDSKFDRSIRGEKELSEEERRGFQLFVTEYDPRRQQFGADCFHCHGGALFTDTGFHNNGLKPDRDPGRSGVTHFESDHGKFSTPSLRNVELTAPYMHDGRFKTLEEVMDHYDHGVCRSETLDPNLAKHPDSGLGLSAADKKALVAFLKTLTDPKYSRDQRADPKLASGK